MDREATQGLSQELREALAPPLREIESLNECIAEYDRRIEQISREVHPEVALLKQVKESTYALTLDDPHRFRRRRDAGCFRDCVPGAETWGMANPNCTSAKKETGI